MTRASISLPSTNSWRAGNPARSRLSGGSVRIRTRPWISLRRGSQTRLHRILLYIISNPIELRIRSNQTIEAFFLPKRSVGPQDQVGLVSGKPLQGTQPFGGKHVGRDQNMNVIRHHDESMQLIPVQYEIAVQQRRHYHLRNFFAPEEQRTIRACIQEPVDSHECFTCRHDSGWGKYAVGGKAAVQSECHKQGLLDYVPMGQPSFIMPHTPTWCVGDRETLTASSRLRVACGQDCPPHGAL